MNRQHKPPAHNPMSLIFDSGFWTSVAVVGGSIVAAAGVWALILSNRETVSKDRELKTFQEESKKAIAEANARAEEASLEQARLKAQFIRRGISEEQEEEMQAILSRKNGEVLFLIVLGDPETLNFGKKLSAVFRKAGWKVSEQSKSYQEIVVSGVYVPGTTQDAVLTQEALKIADLDFRSEPIPTEPGTRISSGWGRGSPSPDALRVLVAPKPIQL